MELMTRTVHVLFTFPIKPPPKLPCSNLKSKNNKSKTQSPLSFFLPLRLHRSLCSLKLETKRASLEEIEGEHNKRVVVALYDALVNKDIETAHRLLAPDLEWWFHGPPIHQQHLMSLLTGQPPSSSSSVRPNNNSFIFQYPLSNVVAFGSMVLVEGFSKDWNVSWVHAWTVTNGIITHVREYFNTSVTVTRFGDGGSSISSSPAISTSQPRASCQSVWQSKVSDNKSVPGLVLTL
ncbi:uncharacterized protein LOC133669044 [Populus nigra]|uniref:uncharacterized protein LOC133669044 n=1 Tax=Populus nigra TaxID=3691 RepID=UPI002B279B94|nr:uncharacterized protein LOC133669044 [Populus nigra]